MFEWNQDFSVGVPSIDAQHQTLFAIARELYDAMNAGKGRSVVGRVLDRLVQYTAMHFAHEERLMRQSNYPGLQKHQEEHAGLTIKVLEFQRDYRTGNVNLTVQLLLFLKHWLATHIPESDFAYAPYVKARIVA